MSASNQKEMWPPADMISKPGPSSTHGNRKGKRKATEAPSPASSQSSNGAYARAFRAAREEAKRSKIKQEPTLDPEPLSTEALNAEALEPYGTEVQRNDATFRRIDNGLLTPPGAKREAEAEATRDHDSHFDASAESLYILSTCDVGRSRFRRRAEELIEVAFGLASGSEKEAPGLAYILWVVKKLSEHGATREKMDEVKRRLMEIWRSWMAEHVGSNVSSSSEAQHAVRTLINAVPAEINRDDALLRLAAAAAHCAGGDLAGPIDCIAPCTPRSATDDFNDDVVRADVHSAGRNEDPEILSTPEAANDSERSKGASLEQFAEPAEMFRAHLEKAARSAADQLLQDLDQGRRFSRQAVTLYSRLSKSEQNAWTRLHRKIRKGRFDPEHDIEPAALLMNQDILQRMERNLVSIKPRAESADPPTGPVFIPVPEKKLSGDLKCKVMFLTNAPDVPHSDLTELKISRACTDAFQLDAEKLKVEQWGEHHWVATFAHAANAKRAEGRAILPNGPALVAEYVHSDAPFSFVSDFTDVDVSRMEVARRVANAFAGRHGKIALHVQEVGKLYSGRVFTVTMPRKFKLLRFYIPMFKRDPDKPAHVACFRPVNPNIPCLFCRVTHKLGERCAHSKEVNLKVGR